MREQDKTVPAHILDPLFGEPICEAIRLQVNKLGLSLMDEPVWSSLVFSPHVDPYSGELTWRGEWRGGARYGLVNLSEEERVYAEYQVLAPLPADSSQFVEAVCVWGTRSQLKGDATLLPMADSTDGHLSH